MIYRYGLQMKTGHFATAISLKAITPHIKRMQSSVTMQNSFFEIQTYKCQQKYTNNI